MTVQDNAREKELCGKFNLDWDPEHQRDGTDAVFSINIDGTHFSIPVEVKSTTGDTVSTARDVGISHIRKWRSHFWIIGFYTKRRDPDLVSTICLTPDDIEPWVASIEEKILPDFDLASRAALHLTLEDLFAICGEKEFYTIGDAQALHKSQWTGDQYRSAADMMHNGIQLLSPNAMLSILKLRSRYISQRGATLNNPHVTKKFLMSFRGTDREITNGWAQKFRDLATSYLRENPDHPFK